MAATAGPKISPVAGDASYREASARAGRQLGSVLWKLALLDITVLVFVVVVALIGVKYGLSALDLVVVILVGVGAVLVARIVLAIRLRIGAQGPGPTEHRRTN